MSESRMIITGVQEIPEGDGLQLGHLIDPTNGTTQVAIRMADGHMIMMSPAQARHLADGLYLEAALLEKR